MGNVLLVAAGGAVGAAARHLVGTASLRAFGPGFPYGTLIVNIVGSLAMGLLVGILAERASGSEGLRLFLATGFLGGFTTFSAFSLDFANMWERGDVAAAIGYAALSVGLAIAGLFAGLAIARALG